MGIMNMFVVSSAAMTAVLFCMLAAHDIAGVATFAVFYGLSSGTCEFSYPLYLLNDSERPV